VDRGSAVDLDRADQVRPRTYLFDDLDETVRPERQRVLSSLFATHITDRVVR